MTEPFPNWHGTTILAVRKGASTVIAGDGQVSMGPTIVKGNAKKVRRLAGGKVLAGFAGATADAFTLIERLEAKLEQYPDQLARACVDLAKDWRTDRYLRRLEAMLIVADKGAIFTVTGVGRRAGAGIRRRRHRLRRPVRPGRGPRPHGLRPAGRGHRPPGHGHRRRTSASTPTAR